MRFHKDHGPMLSAEFQVKSKSIKVKGTVRPWDGEAALAHTPGLGKGGDSEHMETEMAQMPEIKPMGTWQCCDQATGDKSLSELLLWLHVIKLWGEGWSGEHCKVKAGIQLWLLGVHDRAGQFLEQGQKQQEMQSHVSMWPRRVSLAVFGQAGRLGPRTEGEPGLRHTPCDG